jgi:transposase-like protein
MAKRGWRASNSWTRADAAAALDAADSSGLSDERFAEREGLNSQRLYYWRRKLARAKRSAGEKQQRAQGARRSTRKRKSSARSRSTNSPSVKRRARTEATRFIEVQAIAVERIEVQLRNGRLVSVPTGIAPATLAALLDAIEKSGC